MHKSIRKVILYFTVVICSLLIFAWLLFPLFLSWLPSGPIPTLVTRIFAVVGYYGLGFFIYKKYYPRLQQRIEEKGFFKF